MATTRRPLAEQLAAADTRKALEYAVREHERQLRLADEMAIQKSLGPNAGTVRPPMRRPGMTGDNPQLGAGLAQTVPLHQQNLQQYTAPTQPPALTPGQQEALDAQNDYLSDRTYVDEAGNRRMRTVPTSQALNIEPPSAEADRLVAAARSSDMVPKPTRPPKPIRRKL